GFPERLVDVEGRADIFVAGIVDENAKATQRIGRRLRHGRTSLYVAYILHKRHTAPPGFLHQCPGLRQPLKRTRRNGDIRTGLGKRHRNGLADPAACPGNERVAAGEIEDRTVLHGGTSIDFPPKDSTSARKCLYIYTDQNSRRISATWQPDRMEPQNGRPFKTDSRRNPLYPALQCRTDARRGTGDLSGGDDRQARLQREPPGPLPEPAAAVFRYRRTRPALSRSAGPRPVYTARRQLRRRQPAGYPRQRLGRPDRRH